MMGDRPRTPFDVVVDPERLFAERLIAAIRSPARATRSLLALNVLVFLSVFALPFVWKVPAADHDLARDVATLALGAKLDPMLRAGQLWRLFSALFFHAGLLHLALNLMALNFLGQVFEGVFGVARFLLVYFVAGLGGSLASWALTDNPSVGASGAIFGVLGGVAVFGLRHRAVLGGPLRRHFVVNPLLWIVLNVAAGFLIPRVDNAAHGGGLLAGAALTALLSDRVGFRAPRVLPTRLIAALDVVLVATVALCLLAGLSQAVSGLRHPPLTWERVSANGASAWAPAGWSEGLAGGEPCSDDQGHEPLVCRSGPLAGRFVAVALPPDVAVEAPPRRLEQDGSVFYGAMEPGRVAYLLVFPGFLEPLYADLWRSFPVR